MLCDEYQNCISVIVSAVPDLVELGHSLLNVRLLRGQHLVKTNKVFELLNSSRDPTKSEEGSLDDSTIAPGLFLIRCIQWKALTHPAVQPCKQRGVPEVNEILQVEN